MTTIPLLAEQRFSMNHLAPRLTMAEKIQKPQKYSTPLMINFIEDDEEKQKKSKSYQMMKSFDPDSRYMIAWRIINLICIYIYLFQLPIALVFENTRKDRQNIGYLFESINIPCIVIFFLNIIVKMKLPFYQDGLLISDPKKILKNYFKFHFILDLISLTIITVYEIHEAVNRNEEADRAISLLDLLFYVKVFEVWQINQLNRNIFQLHRKTLGIYNIVILVLNILSISNIMACLFFQISISSCFNESVSPNLASCWVLQTHIGNTPLFYHAWYVQYIYSLYWASTTMLGVGYGDIVPRNINEVAFTIYAQYIACAIFAYSVNEVWQIFTEMREVETKHQKQFNIINRYMRDRNVKSIVSNKVRTYLTHYYKYERKGEKDKEQQIIDDLAPAIKQELLMDSYGCIFKFKIFQKFSQDLFETLVHKVEQTRYPDGEIIQSPQEEQTDPSICYIFKGSIVVSIKIQSKVKQINVLTKESIFGEYQFITQNIRQIVLTTTNYCSIYFLKSSHFLKQIQDKDFEQYFILKHSALYLNNLKDINIKCYFCESNEHLSEDCCTAKIRGNTLNMIRNYRSTVNMRCMFNRPCRRLVNKLVSRNQFRAVIRMIRNKLQQNAKEKSEDDLLSLNSSIHETEPIGVNSQLSLKESYHNRRGVSQAYQIKPLKFSRTASLKELEIPHAKSSATLKHHNEFNELLITEGVNVDEIEVYEYYFPAHNMNAIVKENRSRKTFRFQRKM